MLFREFLSSKGFIEVSGWLYVMYSTALYSTALYSTALYSTALYGTALYSTALYGTALYCTALYGTALYSTALYSTALYSTRLHRTELYCSTLYCTVLYSAATDADVYGCWERIAKKLDSYRCHDVNVILLQGCMWCGNKCRTLRLQKTGTYFGCLISERKMSIVDVVFLTSFLIDHYAVQLAAILRHLYHYLYHPWPRNTIGIY
jgi:hypothetical protein